MGSHLPPQPPMKVAAHAMSTGMGPKSGCCRHRMNLSSMVLDILRAGWSKEECPKEVPGECVLVESDRYRHGCP